MVKFKFYVIVAICIFVFYFVGVFTGFFTGYQRGIDKGKIEALEVIAATIKIREDINNETANLDSVNLCIALGGLSDSCNTLMRGLDEASKGE